MTTGNRWRLVCLLLVGLGLAVSGYLLLRSFAIVQGDGGDAIDVCRAIFGAGCDEALRSDSSRLLGIPLAGWGIVYYGSLGCLLTMAWLLGRAFDKTAQTAAVALSMAGLIASLALAAIVALHWAPFCPLCFVLHAVNLLLAPALVRMSNHRLGELLAALRAGARYALGGTTASQGDAAWRALGLVAAALFAALLYQWVLIEWERCLTRAERGPPAEQVLAEYEAEQVHEISIDDDDPRLGPADAPAQLVVFSSFQCPGCRKFAAQTRRLTSRFGDSLTIVFKHYPLSTNCNAHVKIDLHPQSCQTAWAAEAARRQGRFWPFHDALFSGDADLYSSDVELVRAAVGRAAERAELDMRLFEIMRKDAATLSKVGRDIELGTQLKIDVTPALFLNGRRLRHLRPQSIEQLIQRTADASQGGGLSATAAGRPK